MPCGRHKQLRNVGFEPVFVDSEALDLGVERSGGNAEFGSCACGTGYSSMTRSEGRLDNASFLLDQCAAERFGDLGQFRFFAPEPPLINSKGVRVAQDDRALNYVLQFTDVAWPTVLLQELQRAFVDGSELLASLFSKPGNKVFDQQRNISRSFP